MNRMIIVDSEALETSHMTVLISEHVSLKKSKTAGLMTSLMCCVFGVKKPNIDSICAGSFAKESL
jgi:hypothetical protein